MAPIVITDAEFDQMGENSFDAIERQVISSQERQESQCELIQKHNDLFNQ